jgi:pimeloyl-ACP methyl ester carboxylesterase
MSTQPPNTIVLIHGLWMTPLSWENWIERYQNAGYEVIAPAWPGMEDGIDALRADPTAIQHLGIEEIVDHYDEVLLDRGRDAAGVAIDAAVKRITKLPFAQLKSAFRF